MLIQYELRTATTILSEYIVPAYDIAYFYVKSKSTDMSKLCNHPDFLNMTHLLTQIFANTESEAIINSVVCLKELIR